MEMFIYLNLDRITQRRGDVFFLVENKAAPLPSRPSTGYPLNRSIISQTETGPAPGPAGPRALGI
jgi:hypothetical protein